MRQIAFMALNVAIFYRCRPLPGIIITASRSSRVSLYGWLPSLAIPDEKQLLSALMKDSGGSPFSKIEEEFQPLHNLPILVDSSRELFSFCSSPSGPSPLWQFWNKSPCRHRSGQKKARWWSFKDSSSTEMGMRIMGERKFKLRLSRFFYLLTRAARLIEKLEATFPSVPVRTGLRSSRISGSNRLSSICYDSRLSSDSVQHFE